MPKVPYPYEVNGKLVTGNGSLIPICSLSNRSLLPSLTIHANKFRLKILEDFFSKIILRDATLMIFLQELDLSHPTFVIIIRRA